MFCLEQAVYMYMYVIGDSGFDLLWQINTYESLKFFVCCNSVYSHLSMYGGCLSLYSMRM